MPDVEQPDDFGLIPIRFMIGQTPYSIDDPLGSWRVVDGVPRCDQCHASLHLDSWSSPPRTGLATCKCTETGRGVVQVDKPESR
jgi:hypothetical protein